MIKQGFEGLSKEYNSSAGNLGASRYNGDNILNTNQLNNGSKDLQNGGGGNGGLQEGGNQVGLNRNTLEGGANAGGGERALSSLGDNQGGTRSSGKSIKGEDPVGYRDLTEKLKSENPKGAFMDLHIPEEYATYKNFISPDNQAVISVKPDGDIVNFISNSKGAGKELMFSAIENGGIKMDNYGQGLVRYYEKFGFEPVAKVKFNPEYAPDGWNFARDKQPDIYVMLHNGDDLKTVRSKYGSYQEKSLKDLPTLDYDEALKYRDALLESRKQGLGKLRDGAETKAFGEFKDVDKLQFKEPGSFIKFRKKDANYMIASAENPMGKQASKAMNNKNHKAFGKFMAENGIAHKEQLGMYDNPERSYIISIENPRQRSIIDEWLEANSKQAENILVKDGKAVGYDPRTKEAYSVDLSKRTDLSLSKDVDNYYSEIDGKKYQLPLYDPEFEKSLSKQEFTILYDN